ncbi:hypothetical protein NBRC111894_581 [Sporolactobacillus inulinus]|uniref:Uncharacterized protein n=1 Tax=Sporolactobacillus inulinus TaxID=2078 RepID=A0A4Y1Z7M2_9BACL|nr:hypothetical protein NBRC111894_581 [Sporolactobacillus inulinus]
MFHEMNRYKWKNDDGEQYFDIHHSGRAGRRLEACLCAGSNEFTPELPFEHR